MRRRRHWLARLRRIVLVAALAFPVPGIAAEIAVVTDLHVRPYVEALAEFNDASHGNVRLYENRENGSLEDERALAARIKKRHPSLVLTIGQEALRGMVGELAGIPTVFCMAFPTAAIIDQAPDLTGVTLAADPEALARVLNRLFPGPLRVGTVYDPQVSTPLIEAARAAFGKYGKTLDAVPATDSESLTKQAQGVLDRVDAFWMVPDRTTHNPDMVRFLLFATRKRGVPLIGPSKKYVKAGALLALTPDSRGIGREAAMLVKKVLAGTPSRDLPIQPAHQLMLSINSEIAMEQGLRIPSDLKREIRYVH